RCLECIGESGCGLLCPRGGRLRRRHAVERRVDLDGPEALPVVGEHLLRGKPFRIKAAAPFREVVARRPDVNLHATPGPPTPLSVRRVSAIGTRPASGPCLPRAPAPQTEATTHRSRSPSRKYRGRRPENTGAAR